MGLLSSTIPNLVNGVSQQPASLRLASQGAEQVNALSSVVEGLRKRPPLRMVARIREQPFSGETAFTHLINRDRLERYIVLITRGALRVFTLDGTECPVKFPDGKSYLEASQPETSFAVVTVADYTFILNKTIPVAKSAEARPRRAYEALVWVKRGDYGTSYRVLVDNVEVAHFKTPDGSHPSHRDSLRTDHIAATLVGGFAAAGLAARGFTWSVQGSTIHLRHPSKDFALKTTDSLGDQAIDALKDKVQRFTDLPQRGVDGFKIQIRGDQSSAFDDYWVRYEEVSGSDGVWNETYRDEEPYKLDAGSMPHALVRESDGSFTFKTLDWKHRSVGDDESSPFPSFTGRRLSDLFFHRNRLGFVADENVVFSRAGEFFDFFRETVTTVLDTDPIDVAVSHPRICLLRHAIPFNETLLLFSDTTQFQVAAGELLTPRTVEINQTTEFESSLMARPVGAGRNVFFCVNKGQFTGVREYYVDGDSQTTDAADITAHVPKYIPGEVVKLAASSNEDILVALSRMDLHSLYVYRYYWSGMDKLQSAWGRWDFGEHVRILNVDLVESEVVVIYERPEGVFIGAIALEPGRRDTGLDFTIHLDHRLENKPGKPAVPMTFSDGYTLLDLPYSLPPSQGVLVLGAGGVGQYPPGYTLDWIQGATDRQIKVEGDIREKAWFLGTNYMFTYTFSPFLPREEATGGGQTTIGEGRLQLRQASVTFNNTGYFQVQVTPFNRQTYTYIFDRVLGSGRNRIGAVSIEEGLFRFPVQERNNQVTLTLVNATWLPCHFLTAEWEGFYTIRSRRL
ncbi:hypothetical protein HEQ69_10885 [Haematospirillum jordaniae]|uniref:phage nozzle protein n=1 Tax=Haematospirillum jordaniae TaxID=1549855 RepID=UPI0014328529|nr:hypothetical protein [Haematospirillum jordaniae]NKD46208.1 hypothetical protein [Haematospirillum jordaniae]